jgi:hypothetical protein
VRPYGVVLPSPRLDQHARLGSVLEPLHAETLVAELSVERFVRAVLPRLPRIDQRRLDLGLVGEPVQDRPRDELRSVVEYPPE